jgi:hypothetical protein
MMSLRDENGKIPFLTVKHLLAVSGLLVSLTFGMFTWEAERAVEKLDSLAQSQIATDRIDAVQENRVLALETSSKAMASIYTDHEKRITVLETLSRQSR